MEPSHRLILSFAFLFSLVFLDGTKNRPKNHKNSFWVFPETNVVSPCFTQLVFAGQIWRLGPCRPRRASLPAALLPTNAPHRHPRRRRQRCPSNRSVTKTQESSTPRYLEFKLYYIFAYLFCSHFHFAYVFFFCNQNIKYEIIAVIHEIIYMKLTCNKSIDNHVLIFKSRGIVHKIFFKAAMIRTKR